MTKTKEWTSSGVGAIARAAGDSRRTRGGLHGSLLVCGLLLACNEARSAERERAPAPGAAPRVEAHAAQGHVDEPVHEELPTHVELSEAVLRDAKLRTAKVQRELLSITLRLPGEVVADPDRSARLSSPIEGRILTVRFREGMAVAKGDVLATIAVPDLGKLRSTRAASLAKGRAARVNATRLRELSAQKLASEQSYLEAAATAEALEVEARAAGEQLRALGLANEGGQSSVLTLRAPIAGVVVQRNAVIGQPVRTDQVLCEIIELSELWFLGRVFEQDLGLLELNAASEVQLNAFPKERFSGVVEYVGRQVDPIARTVTARIRLTNREDKLRVGLFGTAYVSTRAVSPRASEESTAAERADARLVVPRTALTELFGKQVVFVQQGERHFELHEVVLGDSAEGKVQVLSGLREAEQVVVEGVFTLKSAVLKSTFGEEE